MRIFQGIGKNTVCSGMCNMDEALCFSLRENTDLTALHVSFSTMGSVLLPSAISSAVELTFIFMFYMWSIELFLKSLRKLV